MSSHPAHAATPPHADLAPGTVYRSDQLHVFARMGFPGKLVVVTFSSYADEPGIAHPGFGEAFLHGHGVNAIHLVCASNRWFQYTDMPAALAAVRAALPADAELVTYGLSMGGFAAINFSEDLSARRVVAISPQFSVDPRKMPHETRWLADTNGLEFPHDRIDQLRGAVPEVFVLYDDRHIDRLHVDRIRQTARVQDVVVPFAGHSVISFLAETGLLSDLVLELLHGRFSRTAFAQKLLAAQTASPIMMLGLFKALPPHRRRLRHALLHRAEHMLRQQITERPDHAEPWYHLHIALTGLHRPHEAIDALRRYVGLQGFPWTRLRLAKMLLQYDCDPAEALMHLDALLRDLPEHWDARLYRVLTLGLLGRTDDALGAAAAMQAERQPTRLVDQLVRRIRHGRLVRPAPPGRFSVPKIAAGLAADVSGRARELVTLARNLCERTKK